MGEHDRPERRRSLVVGLSARPSSQANRSRYGGAWLGQISSTSLGSLLPSTATAVLASRAETPIRSAPVTSFNMAQRPFRRAHRATARAAPEGRACRARQASMHFGERRCCGVTRCPASATSERRSRTGPHGIIRHLEQHGIDALSDQRTNDAGLCMRKAQGPVSAASAQPRSGSGVERKYSAISLGALRPGSYARRSARLRIGSCRRRLLRGLPRASRPAGRSMLKGSWRCDRCVVFLAVA